MAVLVRLITVVSLLALAGVVFWAPWRTQPTVAAGTAQLVDSDGNPIAADGTFQPVPGFSNVPPHQLIRYGMPEPSAVPTLQSGVQSMTFADLWADGDMTIDASGERVGTPGQSEFPAGTTAEDMMLFFLDLDDMRSLQPQEGTVRAELDGKRVRIAGYTTPVGFAEGERSFLLVPELGACIHVPPPPPNQIVYVKEAAGELDMFEPVWITGTLRADPVATILADVGYRMENVVAEPYH